MSIEISLPDPQASIDMMIKLIADDPRFGMLAATILNLLIITLQGRGESMSDMDVDDPHMNLVLETIGLSLMGVGQGLGVHSREITRTVTEVISAKEGKGEKLN